MICLLTQTLLAQLIDRGEIERLEVAELLVGGVGKEGIGKLRVTGQGRAVHIGLSLIHI